jgi:hypothetical protein
MLSVEDVAEQMYKMVADAQGVKQLKPGDLTKAIMQIHGDKVDKKLCKDAIKQLVNSGRCIYTYFGGSYLELPRKEGASND